MSDNEDNAASASREQDRFLPIANIARIMKKTLPGNAKIAKDAKETVQECVSEFISFITSEASDKCLKEKRKTINGDDLLCAMSTLGFEDYVEPLKLYLQKFREAEALQGKDVKKEAAQSTTPRASSVPQGASGAMPSFQMPTLPPGSNLGMMPAFGAQPPNLGRS
ncbi:hypothetical protein CEUSTIGMA_g626.t1 [Chlamydomonas eustigma]|uniref:Transcription factor CBF/NF-Y/archaeal histone domain-containing protein n=1 Tax=Chlamydomonas eustigma TaxID=1157962 RepID=A0A250WQT4_9CHLO|nr:hypothetical protein CEUSTIGMA_g626.t1 [Chlamydomonas eustigma]|eukprot:GAX73173.1 hypothetical protein CEUSTIGMA_g626.t1 [Chlamydomonas eustigma]